MLLGELLKIADPHLTSWALEERKLRALVQNPVCSVESTKRKKQAWGEESKIGMRGLRHIFAKEKLKSARKRLDYLYHTGQSCLTGFFA